MSADSFEARVAALDRLLGEQDRLLVAFSGGVDSGVLLHAARRVLGDGAAGLIADSPSLPRRELAEALAFAREIGARVEVVETDELSDPLYRANTGDRCYHCKRALFDVMTAWARAQGFETLAFGEIADDAFDDRPGAVAAAEAGVHAPLRAAGFTKADVRRYAREHGLALSDKPSSACLASRIPVGTEVSRAGLLRVERAEEALRDLGLVQLRVRNHGERARVEVGADELAGARELQEEIGALLAVLGFETFELAVYRDPGARPAAE